MENNRDKSIQYRNISLLVRPARVAILIDEQDDCWKHVLIRLFEWCSKVWGGAYFLIVPTDGQDIKEQFWQILEEYSPDLVYSYLSTIEDLETADPNQYKKILDRYRASVRKQIPDIQEDAIEDFLERDIKPWKRREFVISQPLQEKIKQRLAPFYFQDQVVQERISARPYIPFPLTKLEKIAKEGHQEKVYLVEKIDDIDCSLAFYSNWGRYDKKFTDDITKTGVNVDRIPGTIRLADLLEIGIKKYIDQSDISFRTAFKGDESQNWFPSENIAIFSPYANSLLKLGRYRSNELFIQDEPVTLIVGDTVSDFCLYYSLSRFQDDVYWMPEPQIQPKRKKTSDYDDKDTLIASVLSVVNQKMSFGHTNIKIHLTSLSLSTEQLEAVKKAIPLYIKAYLVEPDEFLNGIIIKAKPVISEKYIYRYIEQDNYTSLYTEVFENNQGVGNIQTPKPKNFGQINPSEHRWITELNIDGYVPPQLHFLGPEIIDLRGSTNETRVSKTGVCYTCPNIGYFGGDIDVTLVRPRLRIVDPLKIIIQYFGETGYQDVRISDKGNFTEETIKKFGSLEEIGEFFKKENNRQLFSRFLETKSSNKPDIGEMVSVNQRAYLDFQSIQYLTGSEKETTKLIDLFITKGIVYRGLILRCSRCRESDWFGLGEIDQDFTCKRCWNKEYVQFKNWKEGNEPKWFYKLDEVLYQGVKNNMFVPLLTLSYLKQKSKRSFLYVPELELRKIPNTPKPDREVDICSIQDGQIVLGECTKPAITKTLIDKLNRFSGSLLRSPDLLVFASLTKQISPEIEEYAEGALSYPFRILNESDLIG
jgi:hypothetical protein